MMCLVPNHIGWERRKVTGDWCVPSSSAIAWRGVNAQLVPGSKEGRQLTVEGIGGVSSAGFAWTGLDFWESWSNLAGRAGREGGGFVVM